MTALIDSLKKFGFEITGTRRGFPDDGVLAEK